MTTDNGKTRLVTESGLAGLRDAKRVRMRARSSKTAARDRRYTRERSVFLAEHASCGARVEYCCTGEATEVHHMAGRGAAVFFDQSLWLAVCHPCHRYVTEHPKYAFHRGLSVRRNQL